MPQRSASRAAPPRRFAPAERVFHLVGDSDLERRTVQARGRTGGETETRTLRDGALTTCCRRPAKEVYAIALSRDAVQEGRGVRWCKGVTS